MCLLALSSSFNFMFSLLSMRQILVSFVLLAQLGLSPAAFGLTFELPDVRDQWYELAQTSDKVVFIFIWKSDCPSCQEELSAIAQFAQASPEAQLILVTTDNWQVSLPKLQALPSRVLLLRALNVESLLRRMGNQSMAVPFTLVLTKTHLPCQKKLGIADLSWLEQSLAQCQAKTSNINDNN